MSPPPDPPAVAIVKAILSLAENLGMEVIAEGVETRAQADALHALGCRRGQRFLYARPLPAEKAERLLAHGAPTPSGGVDVTPR